MKAAPHAQVGWRLGKAGRVGQQRPARLRGQQPQRGQQTDVLDRRANAVLGRDQ